MEDARQERANANELVAKLKLVVNLQVSNIVARRSGAFAVEYVRRFAAEPE